MKIVIDIPQGLKIDFENENWTALTCAEMKDALMNGTPLPKGHGRLIDADAYVEKYDCCGYLEDIEVDYFNTVIPTIIEADK